MLVSSKAIFPPMVTYRDRVYQRQFRRRLNFHNVSICALLSILSDICSTARICLNLPSLINWVNGCHCLSFHAYGYECPGIGRIHICNIIPKNVINSLIVISWFHGRPDIVCLEDISVWFAYLFDSFTMSNQIPIGRNFSNDVKGDVKNDLPQPKRNVVFPCCPAFLGLSTWCPNSHFIPWMDSAGLFFLNLHTYVTNL